MLMLPWVKMDVTHLLYMTSDHFTTELNWSQKIFERVSRRPTFRTRIGKLCCCCVCVPHLDVDGGGEAPPPHPRVFLHQLSPLVRAEVRLALLHLPQSLLVFPKNLLNIPAAARNRKWDFTANWLNSIRLRCYITKKSKGGAFKRIQKVTESAHF